MPEQNQPVDQWKFGAIAMAVGFVVWLAVILLSPPRIPGGDFLCYKDPGVNWALGQGLVERLSPANHTLEPKFYSNYPPLHPIVYGVFVRIFGLGPKVDEIFDFLLLAGSAALFWFYVIPRHGDRRQWKPALVALLLIILLLPVGAFWSQRERPDHLGFITIMVSLFVLRKPLTPLSLGAATFIAGLNSLISPFAFVMNCLVMGVQVLVRDDDSLFSAKQTGRRLRLIVTAAVAVGIPVAALFVIQRLNDPEAIGRFSSVASGEATEGQAGLGFFLSLFRGNPAHYLSAFKRYDSLRYQWMLLNLGFACLLLLFYFFFSAARRGQARSRWQALAIFGIAASTVAVFPYQPVYASFSTALILVAAAGIIQRRDSAYLWTVAASLALLASLSVPYAVREFVIAVQETGSFERMKRVADSLRPAPGEKPLVVAVGPSTYFNFKRDGFIVQAISDIPEKKSEDIDLYAWSANGTRLGTPRRFHAWWKSETMESIYEPQFKVTKVHGWTVYGFISSWESELFRHKDRPLPRPMESVVPAQ